MKHLKKLIASVGLIIASALLGIFIWGGAVRCIRSSSDALVVLGFVLFAIAIAVPLGSIISALFWLWPTVVKMQETPEPVSIFDFDKEKPHEKR